MMMMAIIIVSIYTGRCTHILVAGDSIVGLLMKHAVIFVGVTSYKSPCNTEIQTLSHCRQ